jgi:hypothetical protein
VQLLSKNRYSVTTSRFGAHPHSKEAAKINDAKDKNIKTNFTASIARIL